MPALTQPQEIPAVYSVGESATLGQEKRPWWPPLLAILSLQIVTVLASAQNTAFQDEALYIYAGRQIFEELIGRPVVHVPWAFTFSGLAYVHPLLSGILDWYLGFEMTRLLSLTWMVLATVAVYDVARSSFGLEAAPLAAAAFATQGPVLFLGGLATHDAMTVGLLGVALVLVNRAKGRWAVVIAFALGIVLFAALITAYVGLLFIPSVLALLGWQARQRDGLGMAMNLVGRAVGAFGGCTAITLLTVPAFRVSLLENTLPWVTGLTVSHRDLIEMVIEAGGPLIAIALLGFIFGAWRNGFAVVLFGTMLLAPVYHLYKQEPISLVKHLAYGALFGAPLAGYTLARLMSHARKSTAGSLRNTPWIIGLATCILLFGQGLQQARVQYGSWPNAHALVELLRTQIHPETRILAEEAEVPRYYLQDVTDFSQWDGLYQFQYRTQNGKLLSSDDAYQAAIDDGYFDLIVLRFGFQADRAHLIAAEVEKSGRYQVLTRIPYSLSIGDGAYTVWSKVDPAANAPNGGTGRLTRLAQIRMIAE